MPTGARAASNARWIVFWTATPVAVYVTIVGTVFMGFCPSLQCWPHTFAWIMLAPSLLIAVRSLPATAIATLLLLVAHVYTEGHVYGEGYSAAALWGEDMGVDKSLWIVVALLCIAAFMPKMSRSDLES